MSQMNGNSFPTSSLADSQPDANPPSIREDQTQNAVSFLSHPKVRSSPIATKRSFLEKKGLTNAEIDEACRRVPADTAETVVPQTTFAAPSAAAGSNQAVSSLVPAQQAAPVPAQGIRWTQVVLGTSVVAAGVYAFHKYVFPYAVDWFNQILDGHRSEQRQQLAEVKQAVDALQQTDNNLHGSIQQLAESIKELKAQIQETTSKQEAITLMDLRQELRMLQSTTAQFSGSHGMPSSDVLALQGEVAALKSALKQLSANQATSNGAHSAALRSYPPASSSYGNSYPASGSAWPFNGPAAAVPAAPSRHVEEDGAGKTLSYAEVLDMVSKGITPPNVRKDINDAPPDPDRPPSASQMTAPRKPWDHMDGAAMPYAVGDGRPYAPWAEASRAAPAATASMSHSSSKGDFAVGSEVPAPHVPAGFPAYGAPTSSGPSVFAGLPAENGDRLETNTAASAPGALGASLVRSSSSRSAGAMGTEPSPPSLPSSVWRPPAMPAPTVKSAPSSVSGDAAGQSSTEP